MKGVRTEGARGEAQRVCRRRRGGAKERVRRRNPVCHTTHATPPHFQHHTPAIPFHSYPTQHITCTRSMPVFISHPFTLAATAGLRKRFTILLYTPAMMAGTRVRMMTSTISG